jgi:fatty acid desaturase
MGPLEVIGPYAGTVITTRKTDVPATNNPPNGTSILIGLLMLPLGLLALVFIGLYVWAYRFPLCLIGLIVIGLWACAHFGSNKPLIRWHRKNRLSDEQRARIERRLSDIERQPGLQ